MKDELLTAAINLINSIDIATFKTKDDDGLIKRSAISNQLEELRELTDKLTYNGFN